MTLGQLKTKIESFKDGTVFKYSFSNPFSWRGAYAEVSFSVINSESTKEDLLLKIEEALNNRFYGYKGGDYVYHEHTDIHFEDNYGSWTDGGYAKEMIHKLADEIRVDTEEILVNIILEPTI